jgi:predicted TIM-barrel fold metal-dependent hydrolase
VRIDAHTHLFAPSQRADRDTLAVRDATFRELYADPAAKMADAGELLVALDAAGIDRAVVAGFAFAAERDLGEQNEYVLAAATEARGRIIPLATVNPALEGWQRSAERALAAGAAGFGELRPHNQGWDPLGAEGRALGALAAESGAVLLWHVSEPVGHAYPGKEGGITPAELCQLALDHAETRMIGAHLGGGLPFYLQMPELREGLRSLWFDTAAAPLLYDWQSVARLVDLAGPGRVLFGSDFPLLSPKRQVERVLELLPGADAEAVCGRNADYLFPGTGPS